MKNRKNPVVSIVGRPNVGKSSLFNRIVGKRHAVVEEREGTTRDRIEKLISVKGRSFVVVDTGGFLPEGEGRFQELVKAQIEKAIDFSDLLLFVADGANGLSPVDMDLARLLRRSGKHMFLVVNKIDNEKRKENVPDFYELGLGEPFAISCLHNRGLKNLVEKIIQRLPKTKEINPEEQNPVKIAICGRPNVGKSSFLNRVLREERAIVHEVSGTTRDSIDTYFNKDGILFLLIDTAGIRHKRKVKSAVDVYSMMRARDSIDRADVSFLILDGMEGVTKDDAKLFDYICMQEKGCVIVVNKWDIVKGIEMSRYENAILKKMPYARNFPIEFISAKTGRNVLDTFNLVKAVKTNLDLFIDSETLDEFLKTIAPENVRIPRRRRIPKFFSMTQSSVCPKEFTISVKDPVDIANAHTSYIENRLRESFPLDGLPIRIVYRKFKKSRGKHV